MAVEARILAAAIDRRGRFRDPHPCWDAPTAGRPSPARFAERGLEAPVRAPDALVWKPVASPVRCIGSMPASRWLDAAVFDGAGSPKHRRGHERDGVHGTGLPWLTAWGLGRVGAVGRDAGSLAQVIRKRLGAGRPALNFAA